MKRKRRRPARLVTTSIPAGDVVYRGSAYPECPELCWVTHYIPLARTWGTVHAYRTKAVVDNLVILGPGGDWEAFVAYLGLDEDEASDNFTLAERLAELGDYNGWVMFGEYHNFPEADDILLIDPERFLEWIDAKANAPIDIEIKVRSHSGHSVGANPVSGKGRYRYVHACLGAACGEDILALRENERRISYRTFRAKVDRGDMRRLERALGYDRYRPITRDEWHIGYFAGTYRGVLAVFLVHSAIEHIFTLDGDLGPSLVRP